MGLTGGYFLAAVVAAVIVLPMITVLLWNRLRGPGALRGAQRLGLIGLCQATAVLLAALMINNAYQLYTSWSDLFGWNGAPGQIQGAQPVQLRSATALSGQATGDRPLPNAALFHSYRGVANGFAATITGTQSKVTGTVLVWLPPQYGDPKFAHTYFPVVQLFSGFPGSPTTWLTSSMAGPSILTQSIDTRQAQPMILVSAAINVDPPHNADCSNIPGGPQVATWLTQDVPELVETSFRAATDRTGWGLMGFSEGGLCASKLALQYSHQYTAAVSMSGDDHPGGDLLTPGSTAYNENAPLWLIQHEPPKPVALLLTGTLQDGATAAEADAMRRAVKAPTSVALLIAPRGGHNVGVWKSIEPEAFSWLSGYLKSTTSGTMQAAPQLLGAG